ncbi:MAG: alpha/beta hydrolase [Chitinophagales bacterium]|nr:alpha/beta hydrolase [Chitinophagales bacterium]
MQPLLLLHGAIGAADQLEGIAAELENTYKVYTLDFSGHGGRPFAAEPFSIALFAMDVLDFMESEKLDKVSIFGYSMGGYVAMYLAKYHPGKVDKIVTLATKFHWDEATAEKEVKMLNAEKIQEKLPAFADALAKRHAPNNWKDVLQKTIDMLRNMGQDNLLKLNEYSSIEHSCMILLGDRDKMITLDETLDVYRTLPNAQMGMLPATHHPIEQANIPYLLFYIRQFI